MGQYSASLPRYTSRLSIPYSSHSTHNTLDLHFPIHPPAQPLVWLIYVHGGAFRDPLQTSADIIPNLDSLFSSNSPSSSSQIAAVASINYRLSPHPSHPTHPSDPTDEGRNVKWPTHLDDLKDAIAWLKREGRMKGKEYILVGHSVGATMALMLGIQMPVDGRWGRGCGEEMQGLRAVIGLEGIYDFTACRDAHLDCRRIYDTFSTGAFGPEEEGGWESGNVLKNPVMREGVEVVGLAHSRGDELVEWSQSERMEKALREVKGSAKVEIRFVEVAGKHAEVVAEGTQIKKPVDAAIEVLLSTRALRAALRAA